MDVGDLVWARFFTVFDLDGFGDFRLKWTLGVIIEDDEYQAGLYKVYIFKYDKEQKFFINDLRSIETPFTIYEDKAGGAQ
jgi:hypothetical protein